MDGTDACAEREVVSFRRRLELPGVELRSLERSSSTWRCFTTGFEFLVPVTWRGDAIYRGRSEILGPQQMLCMHPGEIFSTPRVHQGGSGNAITIDPELFYDHLDRHVVHPRRRRLPWLVAPSLALATRHAHLCRTLSRVDATEPELRATFAAFVAAVAVELIGGAPTPLPPGGSSERLLAASVRERLCRPEERIDLDRLAREVGISRFRLLRVFKREYGLPPRAYEIRVRIGRAQLALAAGDTPANVALEHGFSDQSHLSNHFKRLVGVTPARYARSLHGGGR